MYRDGRGVAQDDGEAVTWFRRAAEQGNARGQSNFGFMCDTGRGVAQDDGEAVTWFRRAAEQGNARGQFNLGLMYEMMLARLCGLGRRRRRRRRRARATPSFTNRTSPATKQADRNSHCAGGVRHSVIVRREVRRSVRVGAGSSANAKCKHVEGCERIRETRQAARVRTGGEQFQQGLDALTTATAPRKRKEILMRCYGTLRTVALAGVLVLPGDAVSGSWWRRRYGGASAGVTGAAFRRAGGGGAARGLGPAAKRGCATCRAACDRRGRGSSTEFCWNW